MMNDREIENIKDIIVKTAAPERVYLFGSYAYGVPRPDSDYDFYVIVPDGSDRPSTTMENIYQALYKKTGNKSVDILVKYSSDFAGRKALPTIEREVYTKGVMLYGNA